MTSRRRSLRFLSVLAGASLIVAACSDDDDAATEEDTTAETAAGETAVDAVTDTTVAETADTSAETTAETTGDTTDGTTGDTGGTSGGGAAGEVGGSACGEPHGPYDDPGEPAGEVRVAWNDPLLSFNSNTVRGNATANNNPLYIMGAGGFNYYDAELNFVNNDQFGTCTLDSLDPLTITYTINEGVTWSDGTPVDAVDLLLHWAAQSGVYNAENAVVTANGITAEADADGSAIVIGPDGAEITAADEAAYTAAFDPEGETGAELLEGYSYKESTGVVFDAVSESIQNITQLPEISEDGRSITTVWDTLFVDYPTAGLNSGTPTPAHTVGRLALGIEDPMEAKQAVRDALEAVLGGDTAATADVKAISETWNLAFDATALPDDPGLYLSFGPYNLTGYDELSQMTFEAREDYTWGPRPQVQTIVYRIIGDPTAAVQALENEEIDIIQPQATADILTQLDALADRGVEVITDDGATYEHVDLVFDNGGVSPFDPAHWDGDEETALAVRKAFLLSLPRQDIIDRIIVPLNPEAEIRESFNVVPGAPNYEDTVAGNASEEYREQDIEGAIQLLEDAGVDTTTPIDVRLLFGANNPRRASEYELIRDAAAQVGFNVIDGNSPTWTQELDNESLYDASLFGWQSTSINVVTGIEPNFVTGGGNNLGNYSSETVDDLISQLKVSTDPEEQKSLTIEIESELHADAFGLPIFQHPSITAYNSTYVEGVSNIALAPTVFWNVWEWTAAA